MVPTRPASVSNASSDRTLAVVMPSLRCAVMPWTLPAHGRTSPRRQGPRPAGDPDLAVPRDRGEHRRLDINVAGRARIDA
jgi:hypothetical protein